MVAALGLAVVVSVPALSLWSGARAAAALRPALAAHAELAHGAATALALTAALAGVLLASVAPRRGVLGTQLAPAPVPPAVATVSLSLAPLAALLGLAAVPAALFLMPIARGGTPAALASLAIAVAVGGIVAETVVGVARRARRAVAVGVTLAAAIALADPVGLLAQALGGGTPARVFALASFALAGWALCTALRPDARVARRVVRVCSRGIVSAALARYARQRQLRAYAVTAIAFGAAGAAALRGAGFELGAAAMLASVTAIVGAATIPLASPGLDSRAAWLWRSAPVRGSSLFLRSALAALVAAAVVGAAGVAAAWIAAPASPRLLGAAAAVAAVVFGCALLAGTIVRWGHDGGQLGSLAAFAAVVGCWSFALGRAAAAAGLEEGVGGALLAAVSLVAAVAVAVVLDARAAP